MPGTGATWIGPCDCLSGAHSCISLLMPPKHKERKKVARTVPAKAKREGSQQDSSLMVVGTARGKPKKPICYWGGCTNISHRWGVCKLHGGRTPVFRKVVLSTLGVMDTASPTEAVRSARWRGAPR